MFAPLIVGFIQVSRSEQISQEEDGSVKLGETFTFHECLIQATGSVETLNKTYAATFNLNARQWLEGLKIEFEDEDGLDYGTYASLLLQGIFVTCHFKVL